MTHCCIFRFIGWSADGQQDSHQTTPTIIEKIEQEHSLSGQLRQPGLRRCRCFTHPIRRCTAHHRASCHRPFQRQYGEHILFDQRRKLLQFRQRHVRQVPAGLDTPPHRLADDLVGIAERYALAHQVIGQIGGGGETAPGSLEHVAVSNSGSLSS